MTRKQNTLLAIDGAVNLLLGALLLLFPAGVLELLGLPQVAHHFYTTILGAVILGIGIALSIEWLGAARGVHGLGLGLGGAIAINLCGGGALLTWLIFRPFDLGFRGHAVLWSVVVVVLGLGIVELATGSWRRSA